MNKGDIYKDVEVIDYSYQGMGVVKIENFSIFVPFVKIGEKIDVQITNKKKKYGFGVALNYDLKETKCPYYYKCGSCHMQHLSYEQEISLKQQNIENNAKRNKIEARINPLCESENRFNYRNKITLIATQQADKIKLGYHGQFSSEIIEINKCLIVSDEINSLINLVEESLNKASETAYNYQTNQGNIRHVIIRANTEEAMVIIVTASGKVKNQQLIVDNLSQEKIIKSIVINKQNQKSKQILGLKNNVVYGNGSLRLKLNNEEFSVKPNAFFQINTTMMNNIINYINEKIVVSNKVVLDAFCGTGTIGLALAKEAKEIIGIEIDKEAVEAANENKENLNIKNATYVCGDFKDEVSKLNEIDLAVIDPPRNGLTELMKAEMKKLKVPEIIYISCDPSTLMRDLQEFSSDYNISEIKGFDMFPNTYHVETVAHLKLKEESK